MPVSPVRSGHPGAASGSWLRAPALWAGLSIMTMWLAVLFVGVFGGNILSSTPGGTSTSVPVVVALLPFVLPATIVAARRGFKAAVEEQQQTAAQAQEDVAADRSDLRTKAA